MGGDAFSKRHPAVNFAFFVGAIGCAVVIQHPAYLILGILCGAVYYLLLHGRKGIKNILAMLPIFLILTFVHTAVTTGRWCGGERPECGPGGRAVKII